MCRSAVCSLLYTLFHLHPWNTCQPSHIQPLITIYYGTLSTSDRQILSIFKLFEIHRKMSASALIERWSLSGQTSCNALQAIQSFNSIQMLHTSLAYPKWRKLTEQTEKHHETLDSQLYDPVFVTLLFSQMLANDVPDSSFAWIELFRTNAVGLLIRSLSSKDEKIREIAITQIVGIWECLEVYPVTVLYFIQS